MDANEWRPMDVIVVCHTEFGHVCDKKVIFDKRATVGVEKGVKNLVEVADRYGVKVTFVVCPEVAKYLPSIEHEIGLHAHPGWANVQYKDFEWYIGDEYLRTHCKQSVNSTALRDYPYEEQLEMIKTGKECLEKEFATKPKVFVAGRWSANNDTIKALINAKITHDCSPLPHDKSDHYDWTKLSRICMPYHPSERDYQKKGDLPLLMVPTSQVFPNAVVSPEIAPSVGLAWLKACFLEYYTQNLPLFHICLHSPAMIDQYFISIMDELLKFISKHKSIHFKFASEIRGYRKVNPKTKLLPYLFGINKNIGLTFLRKIFTGFSFPKNFWRSKQAIFNQF